jgi:hypothetical protein
VSETKVTAIFINYLQDICLGMKMAVIDTDVCRQLKIKY